MIGKYQRRNLLVDEIEIQALLLRNRIADMIQDEFAREMNYLVYEDARRCCEGCQIDDLSLILFFLLLVFVILKMLLQCCNPLLWPCK